MNLNDFVDWGDGPWPAYPGDVKLWWWLMYRTVCRIAGHKPHPFKGDLRPTCYICSRCRSVGIVRKYRKVSDGDY